MHTMLFLCVSNNRLACINCQHIVTDLLAPPRLPVDCFSPKGEWSTGVGVLHLIASRTVWDCFQYLGC